MSLKSALTRRLLAAGAAASIASGAAFIGLREGEVRNVYPDVGGVQTYCFGGTLPSGSGSRTFTEQECTEQLLRDTQRFWDGVAAEVGRDMPWSVHASMTSAAYNAGLAGFRTSPMLPHLRGGNWDAACAALVAPWRTSKGTARGWRATVQLVPHRGLENRRAAEYELCIKDLRGGG